MNQYKLRGMRMECEGGDLFLVSISRCGGSAA